MQKRPFLKAVIAALFSTLFATACQPNDQKLLSVKERLDKGEIIEFDEPGFRHSGCRDHMRDWDMRLTDKNERMRVVVGKQASTVSPGIFSCYRVGSRVDIQVTRWDSKVNDYVQDKSLDGNIVIRKLIWARADRLNKGRMKGLFFESSENFSSYMSGLEKRLRDKGEEYVTVAQFSYVPGSAHDEKALVDQDKLSDLSDDFEQTKNDGDCLGRCGKFRDNIEVPRDFHALVMNGQLQSWILVGHQSHYKQGLEVQMKNHFKDPQPVAQLKIKRLTRFKTWALDTYFKADTQMLQAVRANALERLEAKKETHFNVVEFEVVTPSRTPGETP